MQHAAPPLEIPRPRSSAQRFIPLCAAGVVLAGGAAAAWHYAAAGLALSHWDARAHLVVARRIFDGLMPGWQQIGAVWLPLPHLLNALPVQVDAWYRSGASATAISVGSMAAGSWALASLLVRVTGSAVAALAGAALLLANPNTLFVQSTPMTEPLLIGTTLVAIALTARWLDEGGSAPPRAAGVALIAACMTRYEAWPITAVVTGLAGLVLIRRGAPLRAAARACCRLAIYPITAILIFSVNSRWTTGAWFVSGDFFVPENEALGRPLVAAQQVLDGAYRLSGRATVWPALAAAVLLAVRAAVSRATAVLILVPSLAAAALLPWFAYLEGHPFRIRYSLSLVVACVALAAVGVALLPVRLRGLAAAGLIAAALVQNSPLDRSAPLIIESLRDEKHIEGRKPVTGYLVRHYDGRTIMMSMGSLAHYMHDLGQVGFDVRDFLHEGNGELWRSATEVGPHGLVGWVIVEERAEGGDALYRLGRTAPEFLERFDRVATGGGVALYRRRIETTRPDPGSGLPVLPVRTGSAS